ncbi:MAG: hypothetical protein JO273_01395 [Methylobacteriaceae bacterium]|nr:hypothetical protein [Methylobacteriaceae bacterium]
MTWFVFILGGALAAAGATAIGLGIDIIDVERGWTQVIAGTVALSGGIVTLALGCILARIGGLYRRLASAEARGGPQADGADHGPDGYGPTVDALSAEEPSECDPPVAAPEVHVPSYSPSPARAMTGASDPLRSRGQLAASRPAPTAVAPPVEHWSPIPASRAGSLNDPTIQPSDWRAPDLDKTTVAAPEVELQEQRDRQPKAVEPPKSTLREGTPGGDEAEGAEQPSPNAYSVDWLEHALTKLGERFEPAVPAIAPEASGEPALGDNEGAPTAESVSAEQKGKEPAASSPSPSPPDASLSPGTNIVGRYNAGGVSYVMYGDGSIEADTASGVYNFRSISELKDFIKSKTTTSAVT